MAVVTTLSPIWCETAERLAGAIDAWQVSSIAAPKLAEMGT